MQENKEISEIDAQDSIFNQIQSPYLRAYEGAPIHRIAPKMNRNDACPLENKKFKKCCVAEGYDFCKKLLMNYLESEGQKLKNGA